MTLEPWPNQDEMNAELFGGAWSDPAGWDRRRRADGCIVCVSGHPFGIIGELEHVWVTTDPEVCLYGYVCVFAKTHAAEPYELPVEEQTAFFLEAMRVARALGALVAPVKMNYEIHGNTLPHLHMHLYPRRTDDAFVGRPINIAEPHHRYSQDELRQLRTMVDSLREATA